MTSTCLLFLQLNFTEFFSFSLYHLLRVRRDPPYPGRTSPRGGESWRQWPSIVRLSLKATSYISDAQTLLLDSICGHGSCVKFCFLISSFMLANATLLSKLKCIFYWNIRENVNESYTGYEEIAQGVKNRSSFPRDLFLFLPSQPGLSGDSF